MIMLFRNKSRIWNKTAEKLTVRKLCNIIDHKMHKYKIGLTRNKLNHYD